MRRAFLTAIFLMLATASAFATGEDNSGREKFIPAAAAKERIAPAITPAVAGQKLAIEVTTPPLTQATDPDVAGRTETRDAVAELDKAVLNQLESQAPKTPTKEENLKAKIEGRPVVREVGFKSIKLYPKAKRADLKAPMVANIDDCINIAVANHIPLQVAQRSIKLAEMRVFEARRNLLPSATIVVERSKGTVSNVDYLGRKQYIDIQQPVFHGGELYFTMKQAETNLEISRSDYSRVKNDLVLQVRKAYYTLEKSTENLALQNVLSKEVEGISERVSKGYEAGVTAKIDFLNVNSQTGQVKYQLVSAEGDVTIAKLVLKQAMNVDPKDEFEIVPSPEFKKVTLEFERVLRDAFLNRPEIKANSLMITYYNYGKGIAKAKGWPKVDLLGQWGLAWEDYTASDYWPYASSVDPGQDAPRRKLQQQWYAGIKVGVPFYGSTAEYSYTREQWTPVVQTLQGTEATVNSFKFKILDKLDYYSDKQLAEIDYDRSRQEFVKIKNDVTLEVREGCFSYEKALIQLETATNKVKYQEADTELNKMKRGMDEIPDSSVVDSLIKLAQEKFGYVQAVTDCKTSLATLEKAIGVDDYFKNK